MNKSGKKTQTRKGAEDAGADSESANPKRVNGTKSYKANDEDCDQEIGQFQIDESKEANESKGAKVVKKGGHKRKTDKSPKGNDKRKKVAPAESDGDEDEYEANDEDCDQEIGQFQIDESKEANESKGAKVVKKGGHKRKTDKSPKGNDKRKKVAPAESDGDEDEYEVDRVLDHMIIDGKRKFLIKWKGYGVKDNTWEEEDQLHCPDAIELFLKSQASAYESEGEAAVPRDKMKRSPQKKAAEKKGKGKGDKGEKVQDDECEIKETKEVKANKKGGQKRKDPKALKTKGKRKIVSAPQSDDNQDEYYEINKVVDQTMIYGNRMFKINWKGYGTKGETWEAEDELNCPALIKLFLDSRASEDKSEGEAAVPRDKMKRSPQKKAAEKKGNGKAKKPPAENVLFEAVASCSKTPDKIVDRILMVLINRKGKREFLIRWKGLSKDSVTWEPEASLEQIQEFWAKVNKSSMDKRKPGRLSGEK